MLLKSKSYFKLNSDHSVCKQWFNFLQQPLKLFEYYKQTYANSYQANLCFTTHQQRP